MSAATPRRPSFISSLAYKDNRTALKWLQDAFGFEPSEVLTDAEDNIVHAEMTHRDGVVMIGTEWADWTRSPASLGGKNTQRVHDGAKIVKEPEDQFYGDRTYRAVDPEGHVWTFSQHVRDVTRLEAEETLGLTIEAANWA